MNRILLTLSANKLGLTDNCLQTTWSAHVSCQIVKKTGNPRAAQRQLGHKNPATTMQYLQFTQEEPRIVLDER
jgi:integrase